MSSSPSLLLTPLESLLCGLLDHACRWMSDVDPQVVSDGHTYSFSQLCRPSEASALRCEARIAGGWVRDKLLQLPSHDLDVSLSTLTGHNFALFLQAYLASDAFAATPLKAAMDAQARGATAISHIGKIAANPEQSKNLETATARVLGLDVDFVNLRKEVYEGESRIPLMSFGTPYEDAMRRDMTVNALFYNVHTQKVEDWTGHGLDDLRAGLVRTPLEPAATFEDDPLRILRCVRFASRFGYQVHPSIVACLTGQGTPDIDARAASLREALARKVSRERIGIEVEKMLTGPDPRRALELLADLRLYPAVFRPPPPMSTHMHTADGTPASAAPEAPVHAVASFLDSLLRDSEAHASLYTRLPPLWLDALRASPAMQRLLWYSVALLSLRGLYVRQGKPTVWAGSATLSAGLKLGNKTTKDPLNALHEAIDLLHRPELERFSPQGLLSRRARIGLLLRHPSITNPTLEVALPNALLAALLADLVAVVDGSCLAPEAASIIDVYAAFWTYVEREQLGPYATSKPLVDGQRIAEALGCEKHLLGRVLPYVVAWEIDHTHIPAAERAEQCVQDLQAAWRAGELVPEAERARTKRSK
ncbi:CCA tRNA nucleotidyltransferase [Malassezia nana]|uniref:CCA tRNA nucleotidyltransferase n=1 Tax=Malassezia nana TaxID=180528 RepID=A0AAF0J531_9BASI|nr:CCA tRNA nucleotidyltransferase [Malassezia nana]